MGVASHFAFVEMKFLGGFIIIMDGHIPRSGKKTSLPLGDYSLTFKWIETLSSKSGKRKKK